MVIRLFLSCMGSGFIILVMLIITYCYWFAFVVDKFELVVSILFTKLYF